MKIGILTFHNAINYGAVLQCYALKETLSKLGHSVEVLDYRVSSIEESKNIFNFKTFCRYNGMKSKIRYVIESIATSSDKHRVISAFDDYIHQHLSLSRRIFSIKDIPAYYDYIIFGSDQIWNPRICKGLDKILWGQFPKDRMKFISYAASLEDTGIITKEQWNQIGQYLKSFDFISVREESLKKELSKISSMPVRCCIDPTLLTTVTTFDNILVKPKEDNYVFLFTVQPDDNAQNFAMNVAKQHNMKLIRCNAIPHFRMNVSNNDCKYVEAISPGEFLGYIKNANLVIANSFHAIAFSLIFEKDFYALKSKRSERVSNILSSLFLSDRIINSSEKIAEVVPMDYNKPREMLNQMRKDSINFLHDSGL